MRIKSFETQAARIEQLILLIDSGNAGIADELANKLGVSRRTIFKEFDYFKGRGLQINCPGTRTVSKTPGFINGRNNRSYGSPYGAVCFKTIAAEEKRNDGHLCDTPGSTGAPYRLYICY